MISLAVTAYEECKRDNYGWIKECIRPAVNNPFVSEIVVSDDCSFDYQNLCAHLGSIPKVKIFQAPHNLGVFGNKLYAVTLCTKEWVLLADSDNVMENDFYSRLQLLQPFDETTFYCPTFGRPHFDYRHLAGEWMLKKLPQLFPTKLFCCAINTGNQFLNRGRFWTLFSQYYLKRFDEMLPDYFSAQDRHDINWRLVYDAADSMFFNIEWMKAGHRLLFVNGLEYQHRHHHSSWARAPGLKEAMTPALMLEAYGAIWNYKHDFKYAGRDGEIFTFADETNRRWIVDLKKGQIVAL